MDRVKVEVADSLVVLVAALTTAAGMVSMRPAVELEVTITSTVEVDASVVRDVSEVEVEVEVEVGVEEVGPTVEDGSAVTVI
jgi:hypothetical protein